VSSCTKRQGRYTGGAREEAQDDTCIHVYLTPLSIEHLCLEHGQARKKEARRRSNGGKRQGESDKTATTRPEPLYAMIVGSLGRLAIPATLLGRLAIPATLDSYILYRPRSFLEAGFRPPCPPFVYFVPLSQTKPAIWISTRTAPGPISQVLPGRRVRHPQYSKKLFGRYTIVYSSIPGNRNWQIETADWNLDVRQDILGLGVNKLYARLEILLRNWLAGSKTVVSISWDATVQAHLRKLLF